jgi:RNase P subunit RPR2
MVLQNFCRLGCKRYKFDSHASVYLTMSVAQRATDLRNTFLHDAAKTLAITSPSTASYLASELIQPQLDQEQQDKALTDCQRRTFCIACGNVFIPGLNCSIERGDQSKSSLEKSKGIERRTIVYHCLACHHFTSFHLPSSKGLDKNTKDNGMPRSAALDPGAKNETPPESKAAQVKTGSKKRARARKDKASLQSLLKKSKEETTNTSPQLDLMDLMMP